MSARTPDWLVEKIALGDLPPGELERARTRLLAEPDGASRLAALEEDSRRTLATHRPDEVAREVQRRSRATEAPVRRSRPVLAWAVPLAAIATVMLFVTGTPSDPSVLEDSERIKGESSLRLHRRLANGEAELLADGSTAREGDLLQLSVVAREPLYAVIVSIDGRGTVTRHLPEEGPRAVRIDPGGARALAHSYALDDAPAFERFVLVTGPEPFEVDPIVSSVRALGAAAEAPLSLPTGLQQRSLVLHKEFVR